jgi:transcriptional regulator with XRE-family HTH domain
MISPEQVRAARAWIKWSQGELAEATKLSPNTIYNLERGDAISLPKLRQVQRALENIGFEFNDNQSIKRRTDDARTYEGIGSNDLFYDDLLTTLKVSGGDVAVVIKSQDALIKVLGISDRQRLERMDQISKYAKIKCLLWETEHYSLFLKDCEVKVTSNPPYCPLYCFLYGAKTAVVFGKDREYCYQVFNSADINRKNRDYFDCCWKTSIPISSTTDL